MKSGEEGAKGKTVYAVFVDKDMKWDSQLSFQKCFARLKDANEYACKCEEKGFYNAVKKVIIE